MNAEDFEALIGTFLAETQEFLQSLEMNLLAMEKKGSVQERSALVRELFRAAHSIKGSALMFGFETLSQASHQLEDCFALLRDRADLSNLESATINLLLQGTDHLKYLAQPGEHSQDEVSNHLGAIAQIQQALETRYGKLQAPISPVVQQSANPELLKLIFENELPPVFARLETELSQATLETLPQTLAALNEIYYQLSGVAGMLNLAELAAIAENLRALIDQPSLRVEPLQSVGWAIAQNLQTAREQVSLGQPICVESIPIDAIATPETEPETQSEAGESPAEFRVENHALASRAIAFLMESDPTPVPTVSREFSPSIPTPNHQSPSVTRPTIRVDLERLTELVNLVGELVINRTNLELHESQLRSETKRIRRSILSLNQFGVQLREEYDRLTGFWEMSPPINRPSKTISNAAFATKVRSHFDTLELDEYSEFHATAIEVIETTQAIAQSAQQIDELTLKFERSTDQLRRITEQLRSRIMQLRVVSFSRAVDHLPRALREMCRAYNKDVNLLLLGRDTKIDESLLDALRDPLVHLLRNAFDHGIEPPDVRKAAGKPPSGQIEIEARHQGGQTIITITDDGRGIDPELIRQRVVEKGLVDPPGSQELSIADLYEFLFWPGFTTTTELSNLSGRGVGLDVVRANLRQVRGTVKVDSRLGKGTSFILKLPLILSIAEALLVQVDRNVIAVPLDAVEEILHIQAPQLHKAGDQPMIWWRDEYIRLIALQDVLHYNVPHGDGASPNPLTQDYMPVVILGSSEGILAVVVERLLGQQEIVVKPLPSPLSKPRGIVGSTILGDGQVATILDVDDIVAQYHPENNTGIAVSEKQPAILAPVPSRAPKILVVDDSYTLRQLLSMTLSRARYRVATAKDGLDALHQLESGLECELVIADIEMPRMDGFELLRSLKAHANFAQIPVAMLTSRSGSKHRQLAMELGACEYFTKPYTEAALLDAITRLLTKV